MYRFTIGLFAALLTASAFGATQAQLNVARDRAIAWLIGNQRVDGSWRSADGLNVQATAAALDALGSAGLNRLPAFAHGVSYLQNAEAGSTDALARQTAALARAGSNQTAQLLAQRLLLARNGDDSLWGAYRSYAGSFPDSPLSLVALKATGTTLPGLDATISGIMAGTFAPATGQTGWGYAAKPSTPRDPIPGGPIGRQASLATTL